MNRFESLVLGIILGPVPVLFCFIGAWFTSAVLLEEAIVPTTALSGLGVGVVIAAIFVRNWVRKAYKINNKVFAAIYIFYSIVLLGFSMGIPILNFPLGAAAGAYMARRMYHVKADWNQCNESVKRTAVFTTAVMAGICCLMVMWAVAGEVNEKDFEVLLKATLEWECTVTPPMFVGMIFFGVCAMILLQYWLTRLSGEITFKLCGG